jgi:nucleoside-diphosphate-sugar epimerase
LLRSLGSDAPAGAVAIGEIGPETDWHTALEGVDTVLHLAARAHVMRDTAANPLSEYRRVNAEGTRRLALAAAAAGVRRFVYLSSAKVNGEATDRPFRESDTPNPTDAYGISKWEAEQALVQIAEEKRMEWVILRTPLLYGPGVRANFLSLMRAVDRRVALPLGAVHNRRSMLYLGNLVDAIRVCLSHPDAANQLFMVTDGEDVSTPELVRGLAAALKVRPKLISLPLPLLRLAGQLTGRTASVDRLTSSLQLDSSLIRSKLRWAPPFTLEAALSETVRWYRDR